MAGIIPGFEYDIFISYRQKDDEYDGWVTTFVNNLKRELNATFKEDISIYFDANPKDGLLETYIVDESLAKKLKCLIFIPILSQTYCDSKSFAWKHEFCAFNIMAIEDRFGRDIVLAGDNVASRILPIKIRDFDQEDKTLMENELGGVLRSIDFIYKSAGVNRPLTTSDNPDKNLNHTYYRDQINKVANTVKEIITAIKKHNQHVGDLPKEVIKVIPEKQKKLKPGIIVAAVILVALIIPGYLLIPKLFVPFKQVEKSIAVLPFDLLSDEPDKQYLADGIMDAILLHLQKFKDFRVMSRTSVEQYRRTKKTTHVIGRELDVQYLLEGSFQKYGENVRLIVKLIKASEESQAWANEYNNKWSEIFSLQSEIAETIAKELHSIITPEEKKLIEKVPTSSLTAYDLYMKATDSQKDYFNTRNLNSYQKAVTFYKAAIEIDSSFARAYSGLAFIYRDKNYNETYFKKNFMDSCLVLVNEALSFDDRLEEAYFLKGACYVLKGNTPEALDYYDKALEINPNYYYAYFFRGELFTVQLHDYVKGIDNFQKALKLGGENRPKLLRRLGYTFLQVGFFEKAKFYFQEAFAIDGNKKENFIFLEAMEANLANFEETLKMLKEVYKIDSTYLSDLVWYSVASGHNNEAYEQALKLIRHSKRTGDLILGTSHRIGYAFYQVGKYKEAEFYFNLEIKYCEESIKLGRSSSQIKGEKYDLAATYAFLGNKRMAYKYLDEFNTLNFYPLWWVILARYDPLFASIRNEEHFRKILQNMEASNQAEHERVRIWLEEHDL